MTTNQALHRKELHNENTQDTQHATNDYEIMNLQFNLQATTTDFLKQQQIGTIGLNTKSVSVTSSHMLNPH